MILPDKIKEQIEFVASYVGDCDDWVTIKKQLLLSLPPKLRTHFSTRDPKTKEQSLNKFEEIVISYYYSLTGTNLIIRTLNERRHLNE